MTHRRFVSDELVRYCLWVLALTLGLSLAVAFFVSAYEHNRREIITSRESAKLESLKSLYRIRLGHALVALGEFSADIESAMDYTGPSTASTEGMPLVDRVAVPMERLLTYESDFLNVRIFNESGLEIARINRVADGFRRLSGEQLRGTSQPEFFSKAIANPAGRWFVGRMTLNRELGELEVPYLPVMRGTYRTAARTGEGLLLVATYDAGRLYGEAEAMGAVSPLNDFMAISEDGFFNQGGRRFSDFAFAGDRGVSGGRVQELIPGLWEAIVANSRGSVLLPDGLYLFAPNVDLSGLRPARETRSATSVIFVSNQSLQAGSLFRDGRGYVAAALGYGFIGLLAVLFWRQRQARLGLVAKERELASALSMSEQSNLFTGTGTLVLDRGSDVIEANRVFCEQHSLDPELVSQFRWHSLLIRLPETARVVLSTMVDEVTASNPLVVRDYTIFRLGGAKAHYRTQAVRISDGRGGQRLRFVVDDVTKLVDKNEELAETLDKQKSMFSIIAHELRTPASTIMMLTDELSDATASKQPLVSAGRHLLSVIDDLRVSVDPSESVVVNLEPFSAAGLTAEAGRQVAALFRKRAVELIIVARGLTDQRYLADAYRLRVVMTNLLRNAALHSGGRRAWLSSCVYVCPDKQCFFHFRVEDDGRGIPADTVERLFGAFERGDTHAGGTGVGLFISRQWLLLMGGSIQVTERRGGGACFDIVVPVDRLADLDTEIEVEQQQLRVQQWARGKRWLLAEDDQILRKATARLITRVLDVDTEVCTNGAEALECHSSSPADVVLTDLFMPEVDGLELTTRLRADGFAGPILAITAATIGNEQAELMAAGATRVLSKPLGEAALVEAIASIIDNT